MVRWEELRVSEQKFESRGDGAMLKAILSALDKGGVKHKTEKRGLDHGVWGTFHYMTRTDDSPFSGCF
jgi:aromatic ring-opening dioxygenase catalytic subunit (LigB family)